MHDGETESQDTTELCDTYLLREEAFISARGVHPARTVHVCTLEKQRNILRGIWPCDIPNNCFEQRFRLRDQVSKQTEKVQKA
jgi:hypothetical protein